MLHELSKTPGNNGGTKRVGRGNGSGRGNYCGKGIKGQKARSGGHRPAWFEGGQTPLQMRLPKLRGFKRYFKFLKHYEAVNVGHLEADERIKAGATVDKALLVQAGYLRKKSSFIKILGRGKLTKSLNFTDVDAVSASALGQIEKAGGSVARNPETMQEPKPHNKKKQ